MGNLPSPIILMPLVVAGIALYAGLHQFILYLRHRQYPEELYFIGAALALACYNVASSLNYSSTVMAETMVWQRWQLTFAPLMVFCTVRFCQDFFRLENRPFRLASFLLLPIALITALNPPGGFSPDRPDHKDIFGLRVLEGETGPLLLGFNIYLFLMILWMMILIWKHWIRGRDRDALQFGSALVVFVLVAANEIFFLVGMYLAEYSFFLLAVVMVSIISDRYETMREEIQDLNVNLENKVRVRTKELSDTLHEVRSLKVQQDGDYFLTTLLLRPLMVNRVEGGTVTVEFLLRQKKQFEFSGKALEIGGDMCIAHTITLKGKKFTVFVNGDAMGKSIQGAGGALVLGVVFNSLVERTRAASYQDKFPEQWIRDCYIELENIYYSFDGSMLISVFLGLLENESGALYYFNAEHPRSVLYRNGEAAFVESEPGMLKIGLSGVRSDFAVEFLQLADGDALIAGSDGRDDIVLGLDEEEQRIINSDEELFLKHVAAARGDLDEIRAALERGGEYSDDLSLLKVSFKNGRPAPGKAPRSEFEKVFADANELYRSERFAPAAALFETACRLDPTEIVPARRLARCYLKTKQYVEMAAFCSRRLEDAPQEIEFAYLTAHALKMQRKLKEAADYGERYYLRDSIFLPNMVLLAEIYQLSGVYDRALLLLRRVLEQDPEHRKALKIKSIIDMEREIAEEVE